MLSLLLAAATLPQVIADPRVGPSDWAWVPLRAPAPAAGAAGYLVELPPDPDGLTQAWLERVVALAAGGAPVLGVGAPDERVLAYLDGVVVVEAASLAETRLRFPGVALVATARTADGAVEALAAGASAVLVPSPPPAWTQELRSLLPDPVPASFEGRSLATAMRGDDLATVVGLPAGFAGGTVALDSTWYASAHLVGGSDVPVRVEAGGARVTVPPLPDGGVLVITRPGGAGTIEAVEVAAERLPTAAEVLARHQVAAARQERAVGAWTATQRLALRVWIAELSRSFEVVLEGPAFFERGVGTDWEMARAWVDGVAWAADDLPELPLLEPRRPPVPPLALRLAPEYLYELAGVESVEGRACYRLTYRDREGVEGPKRRGSACIDRATFGLAELVEVAEELPGEVRSTRQTTSYEHRVESGVDLWLPSRVVADDLMAAFGGSASIHRELTLSGLEIGPAELGPERAAAWARDHQMMRDTAAGLRRLLPDGRGGRVVEDGARPAQRFLLAGVVVDPGLDFPIPYGGLQIQDFDFRGRGEQLRVFAAGVVNDAAWSRRLGRAELSLRGFTQLLAFSSSLAVRGEEVPEEDVEQRTQRLGASLALPAGPGRVLLDVGVNRLDFGRADETAEDFVIPADTWEGVAKLEGETVLGTTTVTASVEAGWRSDWEAWGPGGGEAPRDSWRRYRLSMVRETTPFPFARLHTSLELWGGEDLDRFSAPTPGRFGALSLRGVAANRVVPDRIGIARVALAVPLSRKVRGELGVDAAWVRDPRSGYEARPLSGAAVALTVPGPWKTLLQLSVGAPLATPGPRQATGQLLFLRPLG